ncbi:MAG: molybdopterin molybdenumtransferase MoeA, partial [Phycisphaerae bacterium]
MPPPHLTTPQRALAALLASLTPVSAETLSWTLATGRILAQTIHADRASPPTDVSAMDGYAVRLGDLKTGTLAVAGEISAGQAPPPRPDGGSGSDALPPNPALRIFTGAAVPAWAEAVIPREDVLEEPGRITLRGPADTVRRGQHIRRRGENLPAGGQVLQSGISLTPAAMAALAAFGVTQVSVFRRVRLGLLITGNELSGPE